MLEQKNKTINEIQQIFAFAKIKFISKCIIKITGDLAIMFKDQNLIKNKAKNKNKCFNCGKLRY